jgi:FO synthase
VERAVEERLEGEAAYELARFASLDPSPAMRAAAGVRDRLFGPRVSYSRKVFIPLTKLCRDNCGYCTFARAPAPGSART